MMVHYRKDENGNIILSEYMFNRLMKVMHNKEKEIIKQRNIIDDMKADIENKNMFIFNICNKGDDEDENI